MQNFQPLSQVQLYNGGLLINGTPVLTDDFTAMKFYRFKPVGENRPEKSGAVRRLQCLNARMMIHVIPEERITPFVLYLPKYEIAFKMFDDKVIALSATNSERLIELSAVPFLSADATSLII